MLKTCFFIQALMIAICFATSERLTSMLREMPQHDAILLNLSRAYLIGFETEIFAWLRPDISQDALDNVIGSSEQSHPATASIASGLGFLMSLPMFAAYLASSFSRHPKARFYVAFWIAWSVLTAYHAPIYLNTGLYSPLPYEWLLFPVVAFLCGALCMTITPQRFRRRF